MGPEVWAAAQGRRQGSWLPPSRLGPPTLSGWHCAAHQAGWRVSQGTSAWRRGVFRTLRALLTPSQPTPSPATLLPRPFSYSPARQAHSCSVAPCCPLNKPSSLKATVLPHLTCPATLVTLPPPHTHLCSSAQEPSMAPRSLPTRPGCSLTTKAWHLSLSTD